ncbi:Biotin carboxyl carrier protein of acetyl-CoA carboxylase 2 [Nymphaea thermarum]|nr:Biotin carboxyl carrier protein of acetyl-CoA carboxylase 2 [Nymphaea thermarum]
MPIDHPTYQMKSSSKGSTGFSLSKDSSPATSFTTTTAASASFSMCFIEATSDSPLGSSIDNPSPYYLDLRPHITGHRAVGSESRGYARVHRKHENMRLVDSRDIVELQLKQLDCELVIRKKEALPQPLTPAPMIMAQPPALQAIGDKVKKGQVLCIIEAMKLMNEIEADQSGTVIEILVDDGKPVSADMIMFEVVDGKGQGGDGADPWSGDRLLTEVPFNDLDNAENAATPFHISSSKW